MDYNKVIDELKRAWDALENLSAAGFSARARIQTAQEMILAVYNAVTAEKKEAEHENGAGTPADEA